MPAATLPIQNGGALALLYSAIVSFSRSPGPVALRSILLFTKKLDSLAADSRNLCHLCHRKVDR
ncbi:hypothetical protein FM996_06050 [Methylosinus sporium]|uniref:Uncharacterized protein n=1 Tax=Methylosinus sporium TaxID=428 RepID=A0A549T2H9_METSR|nr:MULTISPECIES: hypothetical protein [Methylosinus]TRL36079.1 hypothetical protein FM996_06050 [Methylosinus sporium]